MESKKSTAKPAETKEKYFYGRGGRKTAIARVRFYSKGKGEIVINDKDYEEYFPTKELKNTILKPLTLAGVEKTSRVTVKVVGGGKIAQSEAVRHGISRALEVFDAGLRPVLKAEGFLTRDPRVKERKKPGLKRARRAPQWSKR